MTAGRGILRAAAVFLALAALWGCGYRFSGGGDDIPAGIVRVYVEPPRNQTGEAGLENTFRAAFTDWFIKGGRFKVTSSPEEADAVWRGTIKSLVSSHLSFRQANVAQEERLTVTIEVTFRDRSTGRVLWEDKNFTGSQDYNLSGGEAAKKEALSTLAADTAERAYRMMMSGF
ncbi:MAG TPA: LptE family protein [Syntrophales bacterium]|nr:LptE family protein [Syntrophales bacterium]HPC01714.1 LptE family protein [Syntrophales bacterium]HRS87705.1 LptE family protein [Syntrophales bacterium]HRV43277.1 LptE family protein [Syntrophales bacterium]